MFLAGQAQAAQWSETSPSINLDHIFAGEINKKGKPVGLHVRPRDDVAKKAVIVRVLGGPNKLGVYTGEIELFDSRLKQWKRKPFSSFFPDHLGKDQIIQSILKAYRQGKVNAKGRWQGDSGLGFTIQGWLCPKEGRKDCPDGAINTAYPLYKKDQ